MKETDRFERNDPQFWLNQITPELREMARRAGEIRGEQKQHLIDEANALGKQLDSTVVGVCGHLTGSGAKEYPVYKENETVLHFVVFGLKDQLLIVEDMQEYEQIRQKAIDEEKSIVFQPVAEKEGYIVRPIDPENVFGRKMQTIEDWMNR